MVDVPAKIRAGIAKAKAILDPMMVDVLHLAVVGRDQHGPVYADEPITRRALVEDVGEVVVTDSGEERMAATKLTFLEPIPIDELDVFTVNDKELNVARRQGLLDPDGVPYYSEVLLGRSRFRT